MLTTIGRAAARRMLTARLASTSVSRLLTVARRTQSVLSVRSFSASQWIRAPATRATKSSSTTKKKTTTTAKKPAAKKAPVKKTAAKKAPKKKAPAKKKVVAKPRPKKPVEPEVLLRREIKALKKYALLTEPGHKPSRSWMVFMQNRLKGKDETSEGLSEQSKAISEEYKRLSSYELEELQRTAKENHEHNVQQYREWVKSHPAEYVFVANWARRQLSNRVEKKKFRLIEDGRLPKRSGNAFLSFARETSPPEGVSQIEHSKERGREWKELSDAQKRPYEEEAKKAQEQYNAAVAEYAELLKEVKREIRVAVKSPPKKATKAVEDEE